MTPDWRLSRRLVSLLVLLAITAPAALADESDPLPSWNSCAAKRSIIDFVERTTTRGSRDYLEPADRIATFDNDGTLWCEMPYYVQFAFVVARVRELAPQHPEWRHRQPFRAVLAGDAVALANFGEQDFIELMTVTHTGITSEDFTREVEQFLATARHPRFKRPYTQLVYQPMLEVLSYLRKHGFQTFIVSGGGVEFMRPWTMKAYGVPPQQVVGSAVELKFELGPHGPRFVRLPKVHFVDDGPGKAVGIAQSIGRQPVIAFGNSDGDLEMLQYTTVGARKPRLGLLVHHTDAIREYAYDRDSQIGRLKRALDEAPRRGWLLIDMKNDWRTIFPPPPAASGASPRGKARSSPQPAATTR